MFNNPEQKLTRGFVPPDVVALSQKYGKIVADEQREPVRRYGEATAKVVSERFVEPVVSAVTLPRDVMRGDVQVMDPATGHTSQEVVQRATDMAGLAVGGSALAPAQKDAVGMGIRAYHGTPHNFDKFKWDSTTRGTGEGAQAFGDGLYFAEHEGIAKGYRDRLTAKQPGAAFGGLFINDMPAVNYAHKTAGGTGLAPTYAIETLNRVSRSLKENPNLNPRDELTKEIDSLEKSIDYVRKLGDTAEKTQGYLGDKSQGYYKLAENYKHAVAWLRKNISEDAKLEGKAPTKGHVYEVDINATTDDLLDWDKPLRDQPPKVREAFNKLGIRQEDATGADLYRRLVAAKGAKSSASDVLKDFGLKGIRFLDSSSRRQGEGTRNFVVFDDKAIEILRKYGVAGLMAGGAAAASQKKEEKL